MYPGDAANDAARAVDQKNLSSTKENLSQSDDDDYQQHLRRPRPGAGVEGACRRQVTYQVLGGPHP